MAAALVLTAAAAGSPAAQTAEGGEAASQAGMRVQLNKMAPVENACRIYLVFENRTGGAFDAYTLDLVMFDTEGAILRRLAVEAGGLPAGKTLVKPFDVTGIDCASIGKLLLNDVMTCEGAGAEQDCTVLTTPSSRLDAPFIK